jgi:hypothetical protein
MACSAWSALGVATTTASTPGSAASSRQSLVSLGIWWRSASRRSDGSRQLAAATSSAPGCSRTARAWKSITQPVPTRATRRAVTP